MKKLLLSLSAVAAVSTIASAQAQDWANHPRYAADNAALTQAPEVVFMGNSITDGWDDHHAEFFTDNNYACRGISGQVTGQMLCRFYSDVINLKPKAVVILAGVNDIAANQGPMDLEHIAENVFSMVELARQHGIRPIIASCIPADTIPWNTSIVNTAEKVVKLNAMYKDYADANGITYVDYYTAMTTPEGGLKPEYTYDRIHPNRTGYEVMEPIVVAAINSEAPCCAAKKGHKADACKAAKGQDCKAKGKDCKDKGKNKQHKH